MKAIKAANSHGLPEQNFKNLSQSNKVFVADKMVHCALSNLGFIDRFIQRDPGCLFQYVIKHKDILGYLQWYLKIQNNNSALR